MTEQEKKMKKYVNAIERRLNLPREVKARVMSDFSSSIQARREAGMTDEQIFAELGTPQKAAADLNEQMREFAYRKSPWRFAFLAAAIYGAWAILQGLWVRLLVWWMGFSANFTTAESHSVGIIGGADGPTAIFVTSPVWMHYLPYALALIVGITGYLRLRKCGKKG